MRTHRFHCLLLVLGLALAGPACQTPAPDSETGEVGGTTAEPEVEAESEAGDETPTEGKTPDEVTPTADDKQTAAAEPPVPESKKAPEPEPDQTILSPRVLLSNPGLADRQAPDTFRARFETTRGAFVIEAVREWSPRGADRFYNLLRAEYYDRTAFFRVIKGFMAQFGIHSNPQIGQKWATAPISDDPVVKSNRRGYVTFAMAGPDTRTTQLFINYGNNSRLDRQGFPPFGRVLEGMSVVDALYSGYGDGPPGGQGPNQQMIRYQGNAYLKNQFPKLDYVKKAHLLE